jgi:propionyl-CoA synthetase
MMKITFITGRVDDVLIVGDIVFQLPKWKKLYHPTNQAAECAVIGINDALKGQVPLVVTN